MANRFPLVVDNQNQRIEELPAGDNLDLSSSDLVNVVNLNSTGDASIGGTLNVTSDTVTVSAGSGDATLTYNSGTDRVVFNKNIEAALLVGQVSDISNHDTSDLSETSTERYFTPTREQELLDEVVAFAVSL